MIVIPYLKVLLAFFKAMSTLLALVIEVVSYKDSKIADLSEKLAAALADDEADDAAVAAAEEAAATARAEADAAAAKVSELQALADADSLEDSQIVEFLKAQLPAPEPTPEPDAPAEEETVES